jgi:hypothetical protein
MKRAIVLLLILIFIGVIHSEDTFLSQISLLNGKIYPEIQYSFNLHNIELSEISIKSPIEDTFIVQDLKPSLVINPYPWLKLKVGARIRHIIGGDTDSSPRFSLNLYNRNHNFFAGWFRTSITSATLYMSPDIEDIPGIHYTFQSERYGYEIILARTELPGNNSYETYIWAGRFTLYPLSYLSFGTHTCIYHRAGFDKGGLNVEPPEPSRIEDFVWGLLVSADTPQLGDAIQLYSNFEYDYGGRRDSGYGNLYKIGVGAKIKEVINSGMNIYLFDDKYRAPLGEDFLLSYNPLDDDNFDERKNLFFEIYIEFKKELYNNVYTSVSVSEGFRNKEFKFKDWDYIRNKFMCSVNIKL